MTASGHRHRGFWWGIVAVALIVTIAVLHKRYAPEDRGGPADPAFVDKLKSAKHFESEFPAQKQTIDLAQKSSLRHGALNAIGMELRDVALMATGNPGSVFAMLSHLGGFGEIIWVDQWTNFPVKVRGSNVPRREAVRAALEAVEASGGCLIKAGENRWLVAKVSEKEKYEAAIRALGWLDGNPPPWQTNVATTNQVRDGGLPK